VSVILDIVVDLVARTAVWLGALAALSAAVASLPWMVWGRGAVRWRSTVLAGMLGALALASLAHRFGLPDPGAIKIWGRPLYLAWSALGALGGAAVTLLVVRRSRSRPDDQ
jgi:hypothetical protein